MKKLLLIALFLYAGNAMGSSLPNCSSDFISNWNNCIGAANLANGSKYVGEWRNGNKTGQGTLTLASGNKYVGDFKDGKRTGQGTYTWTNGNKYVGDFKDGKRTGQGTLTWASGDKYVGDFKDGKRTGQGTYTWASGSKYVGGFKDGKLNEQGTLTFADGTVKKGVWENGSYFGTKAEWDAKIAKEEYEKKLLAEKIAKEEKERLAREREAEKKYNTIYNACLLDKSKEVDMQVSTISEAVYKTCIDIATDPSWYENFKYNK